MAFHADLAFGKRYEKIALEMLDCSGDAELPPEGVAFSNWDFRVGGRAYEVKSDRNTARTGNLCFEYEHTRIPSGISITKADDWLYFAVTPGGHYAYKIPVARIREVVSEPGTRRWHCDGGNSRFYLVPESRFEEYRWTASN